jgi:hypothetical protein
MVDPGVVLKLRNGKTEVFSEQAPLHLFAQQFDEAAAAYRGNEPPAPIGEAAQLREALENATEESRGHYERRNAEFLELADALGRATQEQEE